MRVEQEARPVGRGDRAGNEVRDGDRIVGDERLLLRRERGIQLGIGRAVHADREPPLVDPRPHVDGEVERRRSELLEPEAELLDEVEREAVAARAAAARAASTRARPSRPGATTSRKRGPRAVPHDRVPERVEPVVRELHALAPARAPRRRAGVLEPNARARRDAGALLLELVREPPHRERPGGNGVLADSLHRRAYSRSAMQVGEI